MGPARNPFLERQDRLAPHLFSREHANLSSSAALEYQEVTAMDQRACDVRIGGSCRMVREARGVRARGGSRGGTMGGTIRVTSRTAIQVVLGASLLSGAIAQEPEDEDRPQRIDTLSAAAQGADPHDRLRELMVEVEKRLLRIDELLIDASTGDTAGFGEFSESGMDDLLDEADNSTSPSLIGAAGILDASRSQGRKVLSGIDEIIKIAQRSGST